MEGPWPWKQHLRERNSTPVYVTTGCLLLISISCVPHALADMFSVQCPVNRCMGWCAAAGLDYPWSRLLLESCLRTWPHKPNHTGCWTLNIASRARGTIEIKIVSRHCHLLLLLLRTDAGQKKGESRHPQGSKVILLAPRGMDTVWGEGAARERLEEQSRVVSI